MNTRLINGYNSLISRAAEKMGDQSLDQKTRTGYRFKSGHYKKALKKIISLETDITNIETARELGTFTTGELTHIERFLEDASLNTEPKVNGRNVELERLQTITGVGPKRAADLLDKSNINLDKLLNGEGDEYLTHHQRMGVKYYHDLNERIPRAEITQMKRKMERSLTDGYKLMVCGSYRREVETSGDMDVLVYHPQVDDILHDNYFQIFIETLEDAGFLVDSLTPNVNKTKYMGMCHLSNKHRVRRIDIRFVPYSSLASAMLYFTGSGEFNKNMRTYAIKKGYKLNEYGIYNIDKSKDTPTEDRVETTIEKDIFAILNLEYIEPRDRLASVKFK